MGGHISRNLSNKFFDVVLQGFIRFGPFSIDIIWLGHHLTHPKRGIYFSPNSYLNWSMVSLAVGMWYRIVYTIYLWSLNHSSNIASAHSSQIAIVVGRLNSILAQAAGNSHQQFWQIQRQYFSLSTLYVCMLSAHIIQKLSSYILEVLHTIAANQVWLRVTSTDGRV